MKLLTLARDLGRRKAREREQLFVAEGIRCVEELAASSLTIRGALVAPQLLDSPRGVALVARLERQQVELQQVSAAEFSSAAETESPQGVLAIGLIPERSVAQLESAESLRLLVLDGVQDPGNVGTIVRTGAALEVTASIALPGTVDLWNAKVVRSAVGAHFNHLAMHCTWDELDAFRAQRGVALWGADRGGIALAGGEPPRHLALVMGNEGAGLSAEALARVDQRVALAIAPSVESLNVAVAAGIFLYQLRR